MKTLITLLLFASTSQAANFATLDELKSQVVNVYTSQEFCPSKCIAIDDADLEVGELIEITNPIYEAKSNAVGCEVSTPEPKDGEEKSLSCSELIAQKDFCPKDYLAFWEHSVDGPEAYCTRIISQEPTGQFELKESLAKKQAKEAKQKADQDAAAQAQETKKTRQTEIDALAEKQGNITAAEIQRLLKALAQEAKASRVK